MKTSEKHSADNITPTGNPVDEAAVISDSQAARKPAETGNPAPDPPPASVSDSRTETPEDNTGDKQPEEAGTPPPCSTPYISHEEMETRIAEAENRGYMRGRNERIEELMREPPALQRQEQRGTETSGATNSRWHDWQADSQPMILNNPRISIWDK